LSTRAAAISLAAAASMSFLAMPAHAAGGFTTGDLVVYRVGAGTAALSSAATAVYLDEFLPTGAGQAAPQFTLAMPSVPGTGTATNPLTASGSATSEGGLTLSSDGTTLLVPGYDANAGVTGIASTTATADPREVGEVSAGGAIDTTSTLGAVAFSGDNPRSATSVNGSAVWVGGAGTTTSEAVNGGVWYSVKGSGTATQVIGGNYRWANIFGAAGGQLYASSGSATAPAIIGVNAIGSGLPATPSSANNLAGVDSGATGSPYAYYLLSEGGNGIDTAYVADSGTGILKYSLIGGTWTAEGSVALAGATGLAGTVSGNTVTLYATNPTTLESITDTVGTGSLSSATVSVLSTLTNADEAYRGVAFAPTALGSPLPEAPLTVLLPIAAAAMAGGAWVVFGRRRRVAQPNAA
jgi:hypothetical protein